MSELEHLVWTAADGTERHCPMVSDFDRKLRTCKRRDCARCGPAWARDWHRNMETNLAAYGGPVVMLTITAPGEERLPWDEEHCAHRRKHRHRGPSGCRVQQRAAREWSDTLSWRWAKLRGAAQLATSRAVGSSATILERAYEPQKRGVPHLHVVLGYRTEAEQRAAHVFVGHVKRLIGDYDFGFADGRGKKRGVQSRPAREKFGVELRPMTGEAAARYLANYLTGRAGRAKKKATIRENIAAPVMPRSLLWLTPKLTSKPEAITSDGRPTGVTMRMLRRARQLYAAAKGYCEFPKWRDVQDAAQTGLVYRRAFARRTSGSDPPVPSDRTAPEKILALATHIDLEMRRAGIWYSQIEEVTGFALSVAGLERAPALAEAA